MRRRPIGVQPKMNRTSTFVSQLASFCFYARMQRLSNNKRRRPAFSFQAAEMGILHFVDNQF